MEEKDFSNSNVYAIPANYTDSGKLLSGMVAPRNAAETIILLLAIGYPEVRLISMPWTIRAVVMTLTLLPTAVLAIKGIDGESLFQYLAHIIRFFLGRRKLHFRRVGFKYDPKRLGKRKTGGKTKRS